MDFNIRELKNKKKIKNSIKLIMSALDKMYLKKLLKNHLDFIYWSKP